ncbi:MAG: N-acetylmuramoyl-L-alanine amidase [Cyanobium sp. SAT1300]|nr:N-acetylmuramoyl-L-alanine amidase [Cyanobium sp. SAT1300]|tara:strand:- start:993 stop:1826 length:834 start_codon:yes stop_codon:yes gene_type:complete
MAVWKWIRRTPITVPLSIGVLTVTGMPVEGWAQSQQNWLPLAKPAAAQSHESGLKHCPPEANPDPLLGRRTKESGRWVGRGAVPSTIPIVVMAGHADSQKLGSAGTPGYAVDVRNQPPMDGSMRDELYWNLQVQRAVVRLGQERGLNITSYIPPLLTIRDDNDPRTNWSQARVRSSKGDYILEIHFDAYSPYGFGSGLIPALNRPLNQLDESIAQSFGRFPRLFRGGLGGPRRGIGILEIGMLEPPLEQKLRNQETRTQTVNCLGLRVVNALLKGVS